jgi:hypothetical protein
MRLRNAIPISLVVCGLTLAFARSAPAQQATTPSPHIYGVFPNQGVSGEPVMIFGHGFDRNTANDALTFNNVAATVSFATHHILFAQVPNGLPLGVVNVAVTVSGTVSNVVTFTVVAPTPPVITAIVSSSGAPFTPVVIQGTGLGGIGNTFWGRHHQWDSFVSWGTTNSPFAFFTSTAVFTLVPPQLQPGTVQVGVTVLGQASNTLPFNVTAGNPGGFGGFGGFGGGPPQGGGPGPFGGHGNGGFGGGFGPPPFGAP